MVNFIIFINAWSLLFSIAVLILQIGLLPFLRRPEAVSFWERSLHINKGCKGWHISPTYFREHSGWLKPGSATMATAWFQQAHEVLKLHLSNSKLEFYIEVQQPRGFSRANKGSYIGLA
jgi:hypothetical protein